MFALFGEGWGVWGMVVEPRLRLDRERSRRSASMYCWGGKGSLYQLRRTTLLDLYDAVQVDVRLRSVFPVSGLGGSCRRGVG